MLGLQVDPPFHRELEGLARFSENVDRLGIRHAQEFAAGDGFEARQQCFRFVDALVEELHVLVATAQRVPEDAFDECLGQRHVVLQIVKRHLRFDHPKLGEMAGGVGVLGTKRRAEGVDFAQGAREDFGLQLATDGQEGRAVEEVLSEVDCRMRLSGLRNCCIPLTPDPSLGGRGGRFCKIQLRYLEHFAGAFAIAGGDDRRVNVEEALFLEELVNRPANLIANAGDGAEGVGARPQMSDGAQELERRALLLNGIRFGIGPAVDRDLRRLHFGGLTFRGRLPHRPLDGDAAAGVELFHIGFVVGQSGLGDDLDIAHAGAVIEFEEAEAPLGIAAGANPTLQKHVFANGIRQTGLGHGCPLHGILLT